VVALDSDALPLVLGALEEASAPFFRKSAIRVLEDAGYFIRDEVVYASQKVGGERRVFVRFAI
jgi:hypothetical protein